MRASRRRQRTPDPLARPEAIRAVLSHLRDRLPKVVPAGEKQAIRMLNAVRNIERRSATDTHRGRPPRWDRKELLRVVGQLRSILKQETRGRVSLNSFVGLYLRVLDFPKDVTRALVAGDVTLFEAAQLARLSDGRLGVSIAGARERRGQILKSHLLAQGSQASLRARVTELLGPKDIQDVGTGGRGGADLVDKLLEINPYDTRHLFWDELRRIALSLNEVTPEDIDDKTLGELLSVTDRLSTILERIRKGRRKRVGRRGLPGMSQ